MLNLSRSLLSEVHTRLFAGIFEIDALGIKNVPARQQLLIASNHVSHLDYGVLKSTLGRLIPSLSVLAAADYFFDKRWKRRILLPLTDLVPVMRQGRLNLALKEAETALANGRSLVIFPEGTRSVGESLLPFRPGIGYLQRIAQIPILPVYISGTHRILPKGQTVPKGRKIQIRIGAVISSEECENSTAQLRPTDAYVHIANRTREAILELSAANGGFDD